MQTPYFPVARMTVPPESTFLYCTTCGKTRCAHRFFCWRSPHRLNAAGARQRQRVFAHHWFQAHLYPCRTQPFKRNALELAGHLALTKSMPARQPLWQDWPVAPRPTTALELAPTSNHFPLAFPRLWTDDRNYAAAWSPMSGHLVASHRQSLAPPPGSDLRPAKPKTKSVNRLSGKVVS